MTFSLMIRYEKQLNDFIFIKDGIKNRLTSALIPNNTDVSDPKELFCLSWIICFYKTSQKILLDKNYPYKDIKINLSVSVYHDKQGFYWKLFLKAGIQGLSIEENSDIFTLAHQKCPVSRMIHQYHYLEIIPILYDDI